VKKFHIVKSSDPAKVAKYIYICPDEYRTAGQGPIRHAKQYNEFVTNFKGSQNYRDHRKFTINWSTAVDGTVVGMFRGLKI